MYIKKVIIEGFKSYREQISTEEFSPKVNCVVGANGSGKSNFFHAIRFVTSDLFHNLPSEERQALLHEGAGHRVLSAFVEIVFDNSGDRIPVDKQEVRLRRTIGVKKDEYFLDGKHISKTEVMNMLESVGFSRSNPYYVVQQGKIASLTLMKDSERLDLLKEIAGTTVYEENRSQSLKEMQKIDKKRKQTAQVVAHLDEQLGQLDEEKEELEKYQQLGRQRKSLDYAISDKELQDAKQQLAKIDDDRDIVIKKYARMRDSVADAHEKCKELDKLLEDLTKEAQSLSSDKEEAEKQKKEAIKKHAKLELDNKDLDDKIRANIRDKEDAVIQLELLEKEIVESNAQLVRVKKLHNSQMRDEEHLAQGIRECEKQLSVLYQKQGRAAQFRSKADRDECLTKEIKGYEEVLTSNLSQEKKLRDEIEQLNVEIRAQEDYIEGRNADAAELESLISGYRRNYDQHKVERDELQDERKTLWGRESEQVAEIERLKSDILKAEKSLDAATAGDIRRGLNSVRRICGQYGIGGVYGPIIELLECDDKFFTAVEVTAGNSLFHVVVENDDISTKIIEHLIAQKGGRVTFVPLNRVRAPHVTYPQSSGVTPLLKQLKFLEKYRAAFGQVFGKTVICADLDVASRIARADGFDCITLEGDQVSKNGGLTGGFHDYRRSKLKFLSTIRQNTKSVRAKEVELNGIRDQLQVTEQKINKIAAELQKNHAKTAHEKSVLEQLKQDATNAEKKRRAILESLEKKEKLISSVLNQIEQNRANIAIKKDEMGTELVDQLTPEEKESISRLNREITDLKEQRVTSTRKRIEANIETEKRKSELEMNLSVNLVRRKEELETEAATLSSDTDSLRAEAELREQELIDANSSLDQLNQKLKKVTERIDERNRKMEEIKAEKDELKRLEDEYQTTLLDETEELEQLLSMKKAYVAKQEECAKKIREMGPLSSDAFETYKRKSLAELRKLLDTCDEELKRISHVNKKALDHCVSLTEKREERRKTQAELDAAHEKIKELISTLDKRKDDMMDRTFKGVAKHFREVFPKLVQGGHGSLVMVKQKGMEDVGDDLDDDEARAMETGKYIGVKVKVCFSGQGETRSMRELSGGQKTVVALALIFAIQRCDPAPFYLFDEVDAALDPHYRTAVANMIRGVADKGNTQLITTTFRQELVKVADKIYGVTHKNRVTHVNVVTKEDALHFIHHHNKNTGNEGPL